MQVFNTKTVADYAALRGFPLALTIGNFDGVHLGHRHLISGLLQAAKPRGYKTAVMTFDPHPVRVLRPAVALPKISTIKEQAELLAETGIDAFIVQSFDQTFSELSALRFAQLFFREAMDVRMLIVGHDFAFGAKREGTFEFLQGFCQKNDIFIDRVGVFKLFNDQAVSTSAVRKAIEAGDMNLAQQLLGRPFRVHGEVVTGAGRGKRIGIPTLNIRPEGEQTPAVGVYAGYASWQGRTKVPCVVNVGHNPTFVEAGRLSVEAHLLDLDVNLYGQVISVEFSQRLRNEMKFGSVEQLIAQIQDDIKKARNVLR